MIIADIELNALQAAVTDNMHVSLLGMSLLDKVENFQADNQISLRY
jgi:predicted aspartyl protease